MREKKKREANLNILYLRPRRRNSALSPGQKHMILLPLPVICSFPFTLARCQMLLGERSFDLFVGSHFLQQRPVQQLRSYPRELAVLNVKRAVSSPLQNLQVCNNRAVKGGIWGPASSIRDDESTG